MSRSLLVFFFFVYLVNAVDPPPPPRGYNIQCGSTEKVTINGIEWIPDDGFISVGNTSKINKPGIAPVLSSVRYFPDKSAKKYCYNIPVTRGGKYLIRTTYFYGGFDGGKEPPIFDQIVGGTKWSVVNTTASYANGRSSYYEIIMVSRGKTLPVCLARNAQTNPDSSPFISTLEVEFLEDSMYNPTNFTEYALATVARHQFGYDGELISYPDDAYNRYWEPYKDENYPIVESHSNISSFDFWNIPPNKAFQNALTTSRGKELIIQWPNMTLPAANYYIVLYFQDNRTPSPFSWRVFDVLVNGENYYKGLNVTTDGVMVYGVNRPLSGQVSIRLIPDPSSKVGPVINAGELFQVVALRGKTAVRDVIAMEDLARSLQNIPADWNGDPCLPREYSWTGVTCSDGKNARVISLNLTNYGLSGTLPKTINNLSALSNLALNGNKLTGPIPDMGSLKSLVILHLQDNQLTGSIPSSLGQIENLKELSLQNNKLSGPVPDSLKNKKGLKLTI